MVKLHEIFPRLAKGDFSITSPADPNYNCIAWATRQTGVWWWPGPDLEREYWPADVPREETIDAFQSAFATLGFVECEGEDLEPGFEKVALFADAHGNPTHAARQLPNGRWASKLGKLEDVEHALHDLEGTAYGSVVRLMKRRLAAEQALEVD